MRLQICQEIFIIKTLNSNSNYILGIQYNLQQSEYLCKEISDYLCCDKNCDFYQVLVRYR